MGAPRITGREPAAALLARKLSYLCALDQDEEALIASLVRSTRAVPAGVAIPLPTRGLGVAVARGCAARIRHFADGRRQTTTVTLPGEVLRSEVNPFCNDAPVALTNVEIADLTALGEALNHDPERHPNLRRAFVLAEKLEAAQMMEQIISLGARPALGRVACWIIDLHRRLTLVDLEDGDSFQLPFTQSMASFIFGMSVVHVARVTKQLKEYGFAEIRNGRVFVRDAQGLRDLAEYEPFWPPP